MSKTLRCSAGPLELETFSEQEPSRPVVPKCEWTAFTFARKAYPSLQHEDMLCMINEHRHYDSRYPQGHFTLRLERDGVYTPISEWMAKGKTHALMEVRAYKSQDEKQEPILFLFLVDLSRALENQHLAERKRNGTKEYLSYDVRTPGVWRFCTSIQL